MNEAAVVTRIKQENEIHSIYLLANISFEFISEKINTETIANAYYTIFDVVIINLVYIVVQ